MNFLCPNCQKMLTVPEQHAGQPMKCPLCSNTFTAPGLPPAAPLLPPPEPSAPPKPEAFALAQEPAPPILSFPQGEAASAPPPPPTADEARPGSTAAQTASAPRVAPGVSFAVDPQGLRWVAPLLLFLVFLLTFFTWVGLYPGGIGVFPQSAWGAAFGSYNADTVWEKVTGLDQNKLAGVPATSLSLVFFLLLLLLVGLPLAAGILFLTVRPDAMTHRLEILKPWRAAMIGTVCLVLVLLLTLQLIAGFGLENSLSALEEKKVQAERPNARTPEEKQALELKKGIELAKFNVERTALPYVVLFLLGAAAAASALDHWVERRGKAPRPRIDIRW